MLVMSIQTHSQASQDLFILHALGHKRQGTFLEIGANHPIVNSNTYTLESNYNWRGILVEVDSSFERLYQSHRPNSRYIIGDATKIDYNKLLGDANMPRNIDYLQIDLDVNTRSTLDTLELLLDQQVLDEYTFGTITFEHDIYTGDYYNTQSRSRQILESRGYVLAFPDVTVFWDGKRRAFEDWYLHPKIVDMDYISSVKQTGSMYHEDIIRLLQHKQACLELCEQTEIKSSSPDCNETTTRRHRRPLV